MSVALPVAAIVFGSVTPPQDDVIDLRVHLGCTKEVSSFDCLLQNFGKKYSPGGTYSINVGDSGSISIGRGVNCPLIITLRVEEIEPESTPLENYIRVRGRCWGEKLFRKVVTKTYENKKGEEIVKDLMDYYVGLSHVRNSIELVEDTDTTYTLLEYENSPVWDILKYIAESADKNGVIGFDFRVAPDGKFEFFPRNSKTSPVSLSESIEVSRYSKDIHRIRNKIMVYGLTDKSVPADKDEWTESSQLHIRTETDAQANAGQKVVSVQNVSSFAVGDKVFLIEYMSSEENEIESIDTVNKDLIMKNNLVNTYPSGTLVLKLPGWFSGTGTGVVSLDSATKIAGSYSVCHTTTVNDYYGCLLLRFPAGQEVNGDDYPSINFNIRLGSAFSGHIGLTLYDINNNEAHKSINAEPGGDWEPISLSIGSKNSDQWTVFGAFDWKHIREFRLDGDFPGVGAGSFWVDKLFFNHRRFEAVQEDVSSQNQYGLRELTETDEELHSDNECNLRAKALLNHLSSPAESLKIETTCLDYGTNPLLPGDKIHIILPNENIDSDFRIISVEYYVIATEQTLEITLELGKEKPLLADYLYGLRATTVTVEKLMRTKVGVIGVGASGGGGGLGLHAPTHQKGGSDPVGHVVANKFGAEGSTTTSTTYVTVANSDIALDPALFKTTPKLYMKIIAHIKNNTSGQATYLRVLRQNAGTPVAGSEVSQVGPNWGIVASGWIDWSAESGNESYQVQMKVTGGTGEYNSVLMVLSPVQL